MEGTSGTLVLQGSLLPGLGVAELKNSRRRRRGDICNTLLDKNAETVSMIFFDVPGEVRVEDSVFCIAVRSEVQHAADIEPSEDEDDDPTCVLHVGGSRRKVARERHSGSKVLGLAVVRVEDEGAVFKRVGLVRWLRESVLIEEAVETTVMLV